MAIDLGKIQAANPKALDAQKKTAAPATSLLNREIKLFGDPWNDRKREKFYGELQVLLVAGVDIRTAFELLEEEADKKEEKELYGTILRAIVAGATLPEAIQKTGKFSTYEFYSLRIGEESGRMTEVLKDLSAYYAKKIKQKRKVKSALSYPAIVLVIACGAVWFMLRFVVPMFGEMLRRFHTELPGITKFIMRASELTGTYGIWIVLALGGIIFFTWSQRKQEWFRKSSAAFVLRLPYIGRLTQKVYLERFCHAMHLLLMSRTTLLNALELVQKMAGFYPIENSVTQIAKDIQKGIPLHQALAKHAVYTRRMISLVRVAEEVNQLDLIFEKLSQQLTDEIEHETSVLSSVIEPVMIIFLGVMVAVILVAMYLPMFKVGTVVG